MQLGLALSNKIKKPASAKKTLPFIYLNGKPMPFEQPLPRRRHRRFSGLPVRPLIYLLGIFLCISTLVHSKYVQRPYQVPLQDTNTEDSSSSNSLPLAVEKEACPQPLPLIPKHDTPALAATQAHLYSDDYLKHSSLLLSQAVQIDTSTSETWGPPATDPRWSKFTPMLNWLSTTFPLVHQHLHLEFINTYAPVFTWHGTEPTSQLRPLVIIGHLDTTICTIDTSDPWQHPPWSGFIDSEDKIWGCGSFDYKSGLLANFEAIELLLQASFTPRRTVILMYAFDRDGTDKHGTLPFYNLLRSRYGDWGVGVTITEGSGILNHFNKTFFSRGIFEKDTRTVNITVRTKRGHAALPPPQTAIGLLSELVSHIEKDPYPIELHKPNPFYDVLVCGAEYTPTSDDATFPSSMRQYLEDDDFEGLADAMMDLDEFSQWYMKTTIAVTLIEGGHHRHSLPGRASAVVEYRMNPGVSGEVVLEKLKKQVERLAGRERLEVLAFPEDKDTIAPEGSIMLKLVSGWSTRVVSGAEAWESDAFRVLAGSTRGVWGEGVIVTRGVMIDPVGDGPTGNLTRAEFVLRPEIGVKNGVGEAHGVNEWESGRGHVEMVKWFWGFLRNMDETVVEGIDEE